MELAEVIDENAADIVDIYYRQGVRPKVAIREVLGDELVESYGLDETAKWKNAWSLPSVCEELSSLKGDELKQAMSNRTAANILSLEQLAERTDNDQVEYKIRKYLAESQGYTKTEKVEIEHSSKFDQMGAEELMEWLESIPGVSVNQEELVKDVVS